MESDPEMRSWQKWAKFRGTFVNIVKKSHYKIQALLQKSHTAHTATLDAVRRRLAISSRPLPPPDPIYCRQSPLVPLQPTCLLFLSIRGLIRSSSLGFARWLRLNTAFPFSLHPLLPASLKYRDGGSALRKGKRGAEEEEEHFRAISKGGFCLFLVELLYSAKALAQMFRSGGSQDRSQVDSPRVSLDMLDRTAAAMDKEAREREEVSAPTFNSARQGEADRRPSISPFQAMRPSASSAPDLRRKGSVPNLREPDDPRFRPEARKLGTTGFNVVRLSRSLCSR